MRLAPVFIVFFLLAASAAAQQYAPDQLIVKYRSAEYSASSEKLFHEKELSGIRLVKLQNGADVMKAAKEYRSMPNVEYAEPNYILTAFAVPNDASFSQQQDEYAAIALETAWNITTGSKSVVIAIIDTGVDWNHPDLSANIWNNTDEIAGNGIDDDHNGYIDDVRGYDFVSSPSDCDAGDDCSTPDNNPMDHQGHGTHVAGIAAAVTNNGIGVAGSCWNCTIMPVRAGYNSSIDGSGILTASDVALAIVYAANNSADIISMSFGGGNSSTIQDAIEFAAGKGSILVAAAGNGNSSAKIYPAAYDSVISVAGTDNNDAKCDFSQYGSWVDVAAPALNIYSTIFDDSYSKMNGTSMAAPMVAGVIGLMKSYNSSLNSSQALQILNSTGRVLSDFGAAGLNMTRINATAALLAMAPVPLPKINASLLLHSFLNISGYFLINSSVNSSNQTRSVNVSFVNSGNAVNFSLSLGRGTNISGFWNMTLDTTILPDGHYNISVNATNLLGQSAVSENIAITIDNSQPNISIIFPENNSNLSGIILLNASVNETISGIFSAAFRIIGAAASDWLNGSGASGFWNASFDSQGLPDGFYNITVNATSYAGKSRIENASRIRIDNTKPNSSIIVPPSDVNLTDMVLINVSANDSSGISNVSFRVASPTNATGWILSTSGTAGYWNASFNFSTLTEGIYNLTVYVEDFAGNTNISNSTVRANSTHTDAVVPPADEPVNDNGGSRGSSSGGGGGGGSPPIPSNSVSHYYAALAAGQNAEMKISKASIALTGISFSPQSAVSGLSIAVKAVKQEDVPVPILNSFQYLQILPSKNITASVVIEFAVNSSWLLANNFTADSVRLNRLVSGKWFQLPTTLKSQDGLKYYYSAESPGFSYFAITAEKEKAANITALIVQPVQTETVPEPLVVQSQPEQQPTEKSKTPLMVLATICLSVAVLLALLLRYRRRRRKHPEHLLHTHHHPASHHHRH